MKTRTIEIEITAPMETRLEQLVNSGLYGQNISEAARRLVEAELRLKWPGGFDVQKIYMGEGPTTL